MQQLSGLDASFLALETANTTGHVGGLSLLDPSDAPEPLTLARLTEVMAERHVQQLAPEHGHERQSLGHHLGEPGQGERLGGVAGVEQAQPADVPGSGGRLHGEEGGIETGELLHVGSS